MLVKKFGVPVDLSLFCLRNRARFLISEAFCCQEAYVLKEKDVIN